MLTETEGELMRLKSEVDKKTEQEVRRMFREGSPWKIKLLMLPYSDVYRYTFLTIGGICFITTVIQSCTIAPQTGVISTKAEEDGLKACLIIQLVLSIALVIDSAIKFYVRGNFPMRKCLIHCVRFFENFKAIFLYV